MFKTPATLSNIKNNFIVRLPHLHPDEGHKPKHFGLTLKVFRLFFQLLQLVCLSALLSLLPNILDKKLCTQPPY